MILKVIQVDLYNKNIFEVFNDPVELLRKRQKSLKRKFNLLSIDVRRELAILFNLCRRRYNPNLYGGLQRKHLIPGLIFIFDYNVNGENRKIIF
jgi:hypothetical protein